MNSVKPRQLAVTVGGTVIEPGQRSCIDLPMADLYTHASLHMPVQVINGRRPGPTLFVCAAIHGDELNGVEIIRRLVAQAAMKRIRGCLIAVPIVNVHGFLDQSRYLPDRRDLNRSFPGSAKGSIAARLAYKFALEIIQQADFGIDLHTGALHRTNLPQIRANLEDEMTLEMARAFNVPLLINAPVRDGSLRGYAAEQGIPTLLYETGEALRFDEVGIRAGLRGISNVMRKLGMLPEKKSKTRPVKSMLASSTSWIRSPGSGIVILKVRLGQRIEKSDVLAIISDPFGETELKLKAKFPGIVIGKSNLPLAHEGDALIHLAKFESLTRAANTVEEFQTQMEPPTN